MIFTKPYVLLYHFSGILVQIKNFSLFAYFHHFCVFYDILHILALSALFDNFPLSQRFAYFCTFRTFPPLVAKLYRTNGILGVF